MSKFTQGVCGDGAAILQDGVALTIEEILERLNRLDKTEDKLAVAFHGYEVYHNLTDNAKRRTSAENVSDVLDAVVTIWRKM